MRRLCLIVCFIVPSIAALLAATVPPATALQIAQDKIVRVNPADFTPHLLDGEVDAIAQVGSTIVLGGTFTQAQAAAGGPVLTRNYLMAFNKDTGAISTTFVPQLDNQVKALAAGPGGTVYVGGSFNNVNGADAFKITQLDVATGQKVAAFKPKVTNAIVRDIRYTAGRLFMGGEFTTVAGQPRSRLAELDPTTGAVLPSLNLAVTGAHYGGGTQVYHMDVTPDGSRLVIIGNFTAVGGAERTEAAMIDLTTNPATVANWQTDRFKPRCFNSFKFVVRDVEFSPDGSYFVIGTTGGYGPGSPSLCDSASRWETSATGTALNPSWIDYTGGDSTYSVAVTGSVIYVGGHQRWWNNPAASDRVGPGAVARTGIAALDPVNGLPLSWAPGRERGQGVFDMLATTEGLFIGSDTDHVNGEYHARVAFFPLNPTGTVAQPQAPTLPVNLYSLGAVPGASTDAAVRRGFTGTTATASTTLPASGIEWSKAKGAVLLDGNLYTAWNDGHLYKRTFNGTTFGPAQDVNLNGLTKFATEMQNMTGMFYDRGRLYYTMTGQSQLSMRYFTTGSDVVGAGLKELNPFNAGGNVSGIDWSLVSGMFLTGNQLYWVNRLNGTLNKVTWTNGAVVPGTGSVVTGTGITGVDWRSRATFAEQTVPNQPPTAVIGSSCTDLACSFTGDDSTDSDGTVNGYAWNFGDGGTSTQPNPSHNYATSGTYTVTLTVTDDDGATDPETKQVQVDDEASPITFVAAVGDNQAGNVLNHNVNVPAGVQAGDALVMTFADNAPNNAITAPAGWEQVGTQSTSGMTSRVWTRVATAGMAGTQVRVSTATAARGNLTLMAYRGTDAVDPVAQVSLAAETVNRAAHTTPTITGVAPGSWAVSYWADKTAATTSWTLPAGQLQRHQFAGTGAGHVSNLATDGGDEVTSDTAGGLTATANSSTLQAVMATIVLVPSG